MPSTEINKVKVGCKEPTTAEGLLVSALDMEDEIAHGVYRDYLDRRNWPAGVKEKTLDQICRYLTILLEDTRRHRKIVKSLQTKLGHHDE
jgi:hypothetical protein